MLILLVSNPHSNRSYESLHSYDLHSSTLYHIFSWYTWKFEVFLSIMSSAFCVFAYSLCTSPTSSHSQLLYDLQIPENLPYPSRTLFHPWLRLCASTCNTIALCIPNNYYKPRKCFLKAAKEESKRAKRQARKKEENEKGRKGKKGRGKRECTKEKYLAFHIRGV